MKRLPADVYQQDQEDPTFSVPAPEYELVASDNTTYHTIIVPEDNTIIYRVRRRG